jgi:hypothetical protein
LVHARFQRGHWKAADYSTTARQTAALFKNVAQVVVGSSALEIGVREAALRAIQATSFWFGKGEPMINGSYRTECATDIGRLLVATSRSPPTRERAGATALAGLPVLRAEGNTVNRMVASSVLRDAQVVVEVAGNSADATDRVARRRPGRHNLPALRHAKIASRHAHPSRPFSTRHPHAAVV